MSGNGQVMFVDDEEGVRTSWQRFMQERGLTATTAPDGASAIDRLSRQPVDVVVSDHRMPGKDGLELLEWLHERQPDTRFIMLTGYGNPGLETRVRALGAVDYLEKPVAPEVLADAVERALAADRLTRRPAEQVEQATAVAPAEQVEEARVEEVAVEEAVPSTARTVGMILAAPLLGLAFVVFMPVVGIAALLRLMVREAKRAVRPKGL